MSHTVLLYGATGFSGRLIAAEGHRTGMANRDGTPVPRMILAARDGRAVAVLADAYGMESRVFALQNTVAVRRGLRDVDVVINAAGPFARTAEPLLDAAARVGCDYVDINGELAVYMALERAARRTELARLISTAKVAVVPGAGHTGAASDLMMNAALDELRAAAPSDGDRRLGAVRIALSCPTSLSRGSLATAWRSLREAVTVVRNSELTHEPVGKLEHTFDFHGDTPPDRDLRVASAANLVDTMTAQTTILTHHYSVRSLESYVEAGTLARYACQVGAFLSPFTTLRPVELLVEQQIRFLPPGPSDEKLRDEHAIVLLDIEDPVRTRIVDWRWETPNPYQFTAQVVVEIAKRLIANPLTGWLTPGAVLRPTKASLTAAVGALRDCRLSDRRVFPAV